MPDPNELRGGLHIKPDKYDEDRIPSFLHHVVSTLPGGELGMSSAGTAAESALRTPNLPDDRRQQHEQIAARARAVQEIIRRVVHDLGYNDELQPGSIFLQRAKALRGYVNGGRDFLVFLAEARTAVADCEKDDAPPGLKRTAEQFRAWLKILEDIGTKEAADHIVDRYTQIERDIWLALYRGPIAEGRLTIQDL